MQENDKSLIFQTSHNTSLFAGFTTLSDLVHTVLLLRLLCSVLSLRSHQLWQLTELVFGVSGGCGVSPFFTLFPLTGDDGGIRCLRF